MASAFNFFSGVAQGLPQGLAIGQRQQQLALQGAREKRAAELQQRQEGIQTFQTLLQAMQLPGASREFAIKQLGPQLGFDTSSETFKNFLNFTKKAEAEELQAFGSLASQAGIEGIPPKQVGQIFEKNPGALIRLISERRKREQSQGLLTELQGGGAPTPAGGGGMAPQPQPQPQPEGATTFPLGQRPAQQPAPVGPQAVPPPADPQAADPQAEITRLQGLRERAAAQGDSALASAIGSRIDILRDRADGEIRSVGNRVIRIGSDGKVQTIAEGKPNDSFQSRIALGPDGERRQAVFNSKTGETQIVEDGKLEPLPDGWVGVSASVRAAEPGAFTQFGRPSATLVNELNSQQEIFSDAKTTLDRLIDEADSIFGVRGSIRRMLQTGVGSLRDIAAVIPGVEGVINQAVDVLSKGIQAGELDEAVSQEFFNETVAGIELLENSLGLVLARARITENRVPVEVIRRSIADVQLTGMQPTANVKARLKRVKREFESRLTGIDRRLKGLQSGEVEEDSGAPPLFRFNPETSRLEQVP